MVKGIVKKGTSNESHNEDNVQLSLIFLFLYTATVRLMAMDF